MATLSSTVELVFAGKNELAKTFDEVGNQFSAFGSVIDTVNAPIASVTKQLLELEAAALKAGAALLYAATNQATRFETSFREITSLDPGAIFGNFREEILRYGESSTETLEDITSALYDAASAGVELGANGENILEFLGVVENLAQAGTRFGVTDLAGAMDITTTALNAFGLETSDAARVADVLIATVAKGKTTLPELASNMSKVAATAGALGVPIEDIAAGFATLTAQGNSTAEAATQLSAFLLAFIKPSEQAKKAAGELGIELNASTIKTLGLGGAIEQVAEKSGGNVDVLVQLFGKLLGRQEAIRLALALSGTAAADYAKNLDTMKNSTGRATEAANEFNHVVQSGEDAFNIFLTRLGTPFIDTMDDLKQAFNDVFVILSRAVDEGGTLRPIVEDIEVYADALVKFAKAIVENLPAALESANIEGFREGLKALFEPFLGAEVTSEGIASFIDRIGATFETLGQFTAGVGKTIVPVLEGVVGAMEKLVDTFNNLDPSTKQLIGMVGGVSLLIDTIGGANAGLIAAALLGKTSLEGFSSSFGLGGVEEAQSKIETFSGGVVDLGDEASITGGRSGQFIVDFFGTFGDFANPLALLGSAVRNLKAGLKETGEAATEAEPVVELIEELVSQTEPLQVLGQNVSTFTGSLDAASRATAFRDQVNYVVEGYDQWGRAIKTTEELQAELDAKLGKDSVAAVKSYVDAQGNQVIVYDKVKDAVLLQKDANEALGVSITDINKLNDKQKEGLQVLVGKYVDAEGNVKEYYKTVGEGGKVAFGKSAKAADDATKKSEDFQKKLLEIASNEKIALIEARVALDVAQVEADTKQIEAAFGSINTAIESTGRTIEAAFGALAAFAELGEIDLGRSQAFQAILDQLEKENQFRQQAFEDQQRLNDAIIDNLKAKTAAFNRGDPLIRVDGTGLEPELRSIMWYMLRAIQVEVNAEFADFLLGLNPSAPAGAAA